MDFKQYQQAAMRTAGDGNVIEMLTVGAMGIAGEAGEVCDYLKKVIFHRHDFDPKKLAEEIGDVLWYAALLADATGMDLGWIAEKNIAKLQARYPDGFDPKRSRERED